MEGGCRCPYCFGEFVPEAVAFKAITVYTQQDLDDFSESERQEKEAFIEKDDEVYENFWKEYPGSKPFFEYEKNPVIANYKEEYMSGIYGYDRDEFLNQATDAEGKITEIRICPHCHNPLPSEFGKYPVKYIALVGITGSGKTVYLSQLFKKIDEILERVDLTVVGTHDEMDEFIKKHKIEKNEFLPAGTTSDKLTPPIPVNVVSNKTQKRYTFIFYDIAGENCVREENINKYGKFIRNADGIIMIVDPKQFYELFDLDEDETVDDIYKPEKVVDAMFTAFVAKDNAGNSSKIPLAAVVSKSDILSSSLPEYSNVFKNADYSRYKCEGFLYDEWQDLNTELYRLMCRTKTTMQGKIFENKLKICFPQHGYFAFSALNCEPVTELGKDGNHHSYINEIPDTIRIEEPFFWLLYKLEIIDGIDRNDIIIGKESAKNKKNSWFGRKKEE